ncbi:hypothetical protein FQN51_001967 [Onygenales sp. PD_10]|nr:hypothetical protein FQN51_001967 [Onygenales sp. PD_10]
MENRPTSQGLRVALEGCGHGKLHDIYASVTKAAELKGWDTVDLVIIGGDFQAVRNSYDLSCMAVPQKYKQIGDFHEYYSGARVAPYLTIFVGGNHEAGNHLFELYYGGWVAPNIYYLGAANVIRCGPLRIAGMSGIWKGYDYRRPHFERLPYNRDDIQSIYHVREVDVRKLLQIRTQVDVGLSHDWPQTIEWHGDFRSLFRKKPFFEEDANTGKLGNVAAKDVLNRLRPPFWFSAHLHCKYTASLDHSTYVPPIPKSRFGQTAQPSLTGGDFTSSSMVIEEPTELNPSEESTKPVIPDKAEQEPLHPPHEISATANDTAMVEAQLTAPTPTTPAETTEDTKTSTQQPIPRADRDGAQLSAWQNFHQVAAKNEAEENARLLQEAAEHQKQINAGLIETPEVNYHLTWKKVEVKGDGLQRGVERIEKIGFDKDQKSSSNTVQVKNTDEIDIDIDSSSDTSDKPESMSGQKPSAHKNEDEIEIDIDSSSEKAEQEETVRADATAKEPESTNSYDIPDDLRDMLPASFRKPEPTVAPTPAADEIPLFEPTLPEGITNTHTDFLALDKCEGRRCFLQLLELPSISTPEGNNTEPNSPPSLTYDKEWLAITRVFANDLILGDRHARIPPNKGDARYKADILAAEEWVEENIVKQDKLTIPHNFSITAPVYDPAVPIQTRETPPEYTNPQTAQFCELVGIENKFHLSDEERQARMLAGPPPAQNRPPQYNRRPRGRDDFGGRGGGGSQRRGGRHGHGGGRGRGRGGRGRRGGGGQRSWNQYGVPG